MIINQCSERGERLLPMWTFVETLQRRSAEASDMIVQMYTANRAQLASWFEHELAALPAESRERTLNALAMALAPESWVVLRERLGLSVEQARDELAFVVPRRLQRPAWRMRAQPAAPAPRAAIAQAELAQMGHGVLHIVEIACRWRRARCAPAPAALASGSLPANWRCARSAR